MPDNNNNGMLTNEISTIREILVGPQMQQLIKRIEDLEQQLQTHNVSQAKAQETMGGKVDALAFTLGERLKESEEGFNEKLEAVNERIEAARSLDKAEIGRLLIDLGNKIINEKA